MANKVPALPRNCNSWVVIRKNTGERILESFDRKLISNINQKAYYVLPTLHWLQIFNKLVKENKGSQPSDLSIKTAVRIYKIKGHV